jgi:hypothetical protein
MTIAELRKYRCVPFVKKGMRVKNTYSGRCGRITGANHSGNLNILFDGDKRSQNCHPHWMMEYYDDDGKLIAEYDN